METHRPVETTIIGSTIEGRSTVTSLASVLAVVPDRQDPTRTRLHVPEGVVLVDGSYEHWMDLLAAGWTKTHTEPFDPAIVGRTAEPRWDGASPSAIAAA